MTFSSPWAFAIYEEDPVLLETQQPSPVPIKPPQTRRPLQELAISPGGAVLCYREPTFRGYPSPDKENWDAVTHCYVRRRAFHSPTFQHFVRAIRYLLAFVVCQSRRQRQTRELDGRTATNMQPATRGNADSRLSLPFDTDGSDSEPDLSVLGMTRRGMAAALEQQIGAMTYDEEVMSQGQYEMEDSSVDEQIEEDNQDDDEEGEPLVDPATLGLKEISNLGKFTVSSHKPGNGVEELRSDDLKLYWQSDGPQPHKLTIYFVKRVGIRDIRFFVDYSEDESYTPTKIIFKSGTSENNLIEFAAMNMDSPVGWQEVPIAGAGGDPDGNTLVSYVLQMQILENHQNGKDTHLRGIKIYAFDADAVQPTQRERTLMEGLMDTVGNVEVERRVAEGNTRLDDIAHALAAARIEGGDSGFAIPDFMRDAEIR